MPQTHDLTVGPIAGHFRRLAVPTAIGMVFTTLYNVVDVYFAGLISTDAQAGLAISFQVFFILIALGFGLSSAMSALVGNALGARSEEVSVIASQGLSFGVIASALAVLAGLLLHAPLIGIISEPGAYREAALRYLELLLLAAPAFLLAFGANGILVAQGDTKSMQYANIAAFFANIALNPLLIFGFGPIPALGFNGIAISTILSQTGVLVFILYRVFHSEALAGARRFIPDLAHFRAILAQALPASFAMIVMMIAGFVIQFFLKSFGGAAVAAYGIALRIEQLLLLPAFGLTGALLPIAAQNFGAGHFERVRQATAFCFKAGVSLMLGAALILWIGGARAMGLFTDDPDVIEIGASYLAVDGFILPLYVMLFAINSVLQALKKASWTLIIGIYRQGFGVAAFSYICVVWLDLGVWGVWFGIATSVLTGFALSLYIMERVARPLMGGIFRKASEAPVHAE